MLWVACGLLTPRNCWAVDDLRSVNALRAGDSLRLVDARRCGAVNDLQSGDGRWPGYDLRSDNVPQLRNWGCRAGWDGTRAKGNQISQISVICGLSISASTVHAFAALWDLVKFGSLRYQSPTYCMKCLNCGHEHEAKYCPECGQPAVVRRLTFGNLVQDVQERFLGVDNLFMRTFVDLWKQPGKVARTYFAGNRRKYIGPGGYLLLMLSLMLLIYDMASVDAAKFYNQVAADINADTEISSRQAMVQQKIANFVNTHMRLINFALLPFYALLSMLFFRKHQLNFVEHMALYAYSQAQPLWISIVGGVLFAATGINIASALMFISFGYAAWLFADFFDRDNTPMVLLKSLLIQVLVLLIISLLGGLLAVAWFYYNQ